MLAIVFSVIGAIASLGSAAVVYTQVVRFITRMEVTLEGLKEDREAVKKIPVLENEIEHIKRNLGVSPGLRIITNGQ